ncbi:hypothetical protein ACLOJK_034770 [Asimina triloba]
MASIVFFHDTIRPFISPQASCFVDGNGMLLPASIRTAHHAGDVGPPLNLASLLPPDAAHTEPDSSASSPTTSAFSATAHFCLPPPASTARSFSKCQHVGGTSALAWHVASITTSTTDTCIDHVVIATVPTRRHCYSNILPINRGSGRDERE